jgi:hypothetical protein
MTTPPPQNSWEVVVYPLRVTLSAVERAYTGKPHPTTGDIECDPVPTSVDQEATDKRTVSTHPSDLMRWDRKIPSLVITDATGKSAVTQSELCSEVDTYVSKLFDGVPEPFAVATAGTSSILTIEGKSETDKALGGMKSELRIVKNGGEQ